VKGVGLEEATIVESEEGACPAAVVGLTDTDGADGAGDFHGVAHQSVGHLIVGAKLQSLVALTCRLNISWNAEMLSVRVDNVNMVTNVTMCRKMILGQGYLSPATRPRTPSFTNR
jgi:hypothetical protein